MPGLFISIDGIDGAGKSTHIPFIKDYLQSKGLQVIVTREPGGTTIGENIRNILLNQQNNMHVMTELYLLFAARQELITQVILPNLSSGICVLTDRYIDASIAYQGYGRNCDLTVIQQFVNNLKPLIMPNLTFIFDAPLDISISRNNKDKKRDRIEQETKSFFSKVRSGYHNIAQHEPQRVKLINTNCSIQETQDNLSQHLNDLINLISV